MAYIREWFYALRSHGFRIVVTGGVPAGLSLASLVSNRALWLPWWGWLNLVGVGILVASFYAFRDAAMQRDKARADRDRLIDGVKFCLTLEAIGCGIDANKGIAQPYLVLGNAALIPIKYSVDSFNAVVQSRTAPPHFASREGYVMPGRNRTFRYALVSEVNFSVDVAGTVDGIIRYFHPESEGVKEFEYVFKADFSVTGSEVTFIFAEPEIHRTRSYSVMP
jgi:hypothetical protein